MGSNGKLLTADEAAAVLGVSRATAYRLAARGTLIRVPLDPSGFGFDPKQVAELRRTLRASVHRRAVKARPKARAKR